MVSVAMLGFVVLAILEVRKSRNFSFSDFIKNKAFSGLLLVFFAVVLSGLNSGNLDAWLHEVKIKLPFLILPVAFFVLRNQLDQKTHKWIHLAFIVVALVSTFHVFGNFLMDREAIVASLSRGKSIPTPLDHIHYSIMIAYAVVCSVILAIIEKEKRMKWLLFVVAFYLFGFVHFLSVRTGLVIAYAGIFIVLAWFVISRRKYLIGISALALMIAIPFIAFHTIESFNKKIGYMVWDLTQYRKGKGNSYSDSERLMSYKISLDLIKEKPLLGHGIGDLRPIMTQKHLELYGQKDKYIYPHNQYLYILACMGILGALIFFFGLFTPLIYAPQRNIFLISIFALMLLSFLVENTIQRAVITGFFLFFILINTCYRMNAEIEKP